MEIKFEIEVNTSSTVMLCSTSQYEMYGPNINELRFKAMDNTITTVDLAPGDIVKIHTTEGNWIATYTIPEDDNV